jgi:hypothetical protein
MQEKNNDSTNETNNAMIIATDIETDKLLNVIEKSKGFSDSKSTTARRLRNKPIAISSLAGIMNNGSSPEIMQQDSSLGNNNVKKINKLIWNQEKLEVEYRDKQDEMMAICDQQQQQQQQQLATPTNNINVPNNTPCTVVANVNNSYNRQTSPNLLLKRQNSGISFEVIDFFRFIYFY